MKKYSAIFLAILIMGCNKSDTSKNNQNDTTTDATSNAVTETAQHSEHRAAVAS